MRYENVLISMDGHTEGFVDLKSHLPKQYHQAFDQATEEGKRVFFRGEQYFAELVKEGMDFGFEVDQDKDFDPAHYERVLTPQQRVEMLDADGVAAELIIDGFGAISTDPELEHQITLAYTRWFRDTYLAAAPHRFQGAVVVNLIAGINKVLEEIRYIHEHGIKAVHLPSIPPVEVSPQLPDYNHRFYEPIWSLLNELGMVVIFHASIGREKPAIRLGDDQPGQMALQMMGCANNQKSAISHLLLAGIPERYPAIRFGFIESGSAWVAPLLQTLDVYAPPSSHPHKLVLKPSEQWRQSCFTAGPLGIEDLTGTVRKTAGVETILFGSDFIHVEGTYPETRARLTALLRDISPEERYAICTDNAVRVMGFDLEALSKTPAAAQGWHF